MPLEVGGRADKMGNRLMRLQILTKKQNRK